jgi:hypothetical protein
MGASERELMHGYSGAGADLVGWAIVKLAGDRKLAGLVSEAVFAGGAFVRIDLCLPDDGRLEDRQEAFTDQDGAPLKRIATEYHNVHAVDSILPARRDKCLALTAGEQPEDPDASESAE